jgi:hypothetical protein
MFGNRQKAFDVQLKILLIGDSGKRICISLRKESYFCFIRGRENLSNDKIC